VKQLTIKPQNISEDTRLHQLHRSGSLKMRTNLLLRTSVFLDTAQCVWESQGDNLLRSIYPGKTRRSSATLGITDPTIRGHKRPVICFDNIHIVSDRRKKEHGTLTERRTQDETAVLAEICSYSSGSILCNCLSSCMFLCFCSIL